MNLMNLPAEMIDHILSYLTYDQIAKVRGVCRLFNIICSDKLNKGFIMVERFHNSCLKNVKTKLPRRESERKHHLLARHCEILMAVETRLSMLSMTYMKYIEARHCCFIPGKVLDEALKVLQIVSDSCILSQTVPQYPNLPRPHDFLQEYRDISSMAMEHFDDKILPPLREKMRQESPHLHCYQSVPGKSHLVSIQPGKYRGNSYAKLLQAAVDASARNSKNSHLNMITVPVKNLYGVVHHTRVKCNRTRKAVITLHKNIKDMTIQSIKLKQKMYHQNVLIKSMKKELRDTRNAMNVMSKELNRLKIAMSSSRDLPMTERPVGIDCSFSLSFPVINGPSTESKGIKRKLEMTDKEDGKQR